MQKEMEGNQKIDKMLKEFGGTLRKVQQERDKSAVTFSDIQKVHNRIKEERKASPYLKAKLQELYNNGLRDSKNEEAFIRKALADLHAMRAQANEIAASKNSERPKEPLRKGALMKVLQQKATILPLWIESKRVPPPPLCGAVPAEPSYIAKAGDTVAALVKGSDGDENWILAEVTSYNNNTNKYEVEDIDEEQKEKHVISRSRVIPLPLYRANPEMNPGALFKRRTLVLALYPQTTCFYRAVVHEPPSSPTGEYQVLFEDTTYPGGYAPAMAVPQRYVICCPEDKKKR